MNTNTRYLCYIKKQAPVNEWEVNRCKNIPTGNIKNNLRRRFKVHLWRSFTVKFFKDSTFSQVLLKDFAETF